ncbi:hypothetical protein MAPG_00372 [Magnaporthiopsis poae ATCC 64411]|uniref:Uncharacterized protein n=1 Tax=Magnaporthiopsis poae (strain ATCC 64411 / 73-15) TaxID=644358 RepID=A0A0C4DKU2_MAGP6|nr:hypothetical protein MAPG_00372 [Magnaporthiopsis poae ATCC 64411]
MGPWILVHPRKTTDPVCFVPLFACTMSSLVMVWPASVSSIEATGGRSSANASQRGILRRSLEHRQQAKKSASLTKLTKRLHVSPFRANGCGFESWCGAARPIKSIPPPRGVASSSACRCAARSWQRNSGKRNFGMSVVFCQFFSVNSWSCPPRPPYIPLDYSLAPPRRGCFFFLPARLWTSQPPPPPASTCPLIDSRIFTRQRSGPEKGPGSGPPAGSISCIPASSEPWWPTLLEGVFILHLAFTEDPTHPLARLPVSLLLSSPGWLLLYASCRTPGWDPE